MAVAVEALVKAPSAGFEPAISPVNSRAYYRSTTKVSGAADRSSANSSGRRGRTSNLPVQSRAFCRLNYP